MNEHATRAWERAKLVASAATEAEAWQHMSEVIICLRVSGIVGESQIDRDRAFYAAAEACNFRFNLAKPVRINAPSPAPAWIGEAAAHDFNDES